MEGRQVPLDEGHHAIAGVRLGGDAAGVIVGVKGWKADRYHLTRATMRSRGLDLVGMLREL